ncbi:MAG: succinylglutamate desuccinylase/aspartoacylase family protein [Anaerovoracaceae bacterium]
MKKELIYELKSVYRDTMTITGFRFGSGEPSAVILGGMRGNELQQVFICSQLVRKLKELENQGRVRQGKSVLVIPFVNPYSINIQKRFWQTDNTDINRMFPGYDRGETTQRIAAGVFEAIKDFRYGIHFTSNYISGSFVPHVRIMKTGYEDVEAAKAFGLPYVSLRTPRPYDTTTLNYNWQIWETAAFSLYTSSDDTIDKESAGIAITAVLNFLHSQEILDYHIHRGYISSVVEEEDMIIVKSSRSGLFDPAVSPGEQVKKGQLLARLFDPADGEVRREIKAPADGIVFQIQSSPLAYSNAVLVKLIPQEDRILLFQE